MYSIIPGAGLGEGFRVRQHAPGRMRPFPVSLDTLMKFSMHMSHIVSSRCGLSEVTLCRPCYGCYRTTRWMCSLGSRPGRTKQPHIRRCPVKTGKAMPRRSPRRKHPVAFDAIDDGYVELLLDLLWPSSLGALLHFL